MSSLSNQLPHFAKRMKADAEKGPEAKNEADATLKGVSKTGRGLAEPPSGPRESFMQSKPPAPATTASGKTVSPPATPDAGVKPSAK